MIDPHSQTKLKEELSKCLGEDKVLLDTLRAEVRVLRDGVRPIQPRTTTAISLVGTDGGNNRIEFDPFLVQVVRVVDSSNNEYCLEAVTPSTSVTKLSKRHIQENTPLGGLMKFLCVDDLTQLSHMIRENKKGKPTSPSWLQVYRELTEWAVLFSIIKNKDFGTDTIIICDGLLRSKVFAKDLFKKYLEGLTKGIEEHKKKRRNIYLVGVAKHSKVLTRYRLAMAIEGILATNFPAYAEIPRELEEKSYVWSEYARGDDRVTEGEEINKFVGGKMYFVKFGSRTRDPIWPVDIFLPQKGLASMILGYMLADAINGFPIPFYPLALQRAHENAALVDFDFDILQDQIFDAIKKVTNDNSALDEFRLQQGDPASRRYS
jgi:hypothetical protein